MGPRLDYIDNLIKDCQQEANRIIVVRDVRTRKIEKSINLVRPNILNIQMWWKIGIDYAEDRGARYVAILSDDVKLSSGQLGIMLNELIQSKVVMISSRVNNKYGWGHAFILDITSGIRPDERFRWYYGDYDLKYQAQRKGGYATSSQEIEHLEPGILTQKSDELEFLARQDRKKFRRKYPLKSSLVSILNVLFRLGKLFRRNPTILIIRLIDRIQSFK